MNSFFKHFGPNSRLRVATLSRTGAKKFSGGGGYNHEPTVPVFHDRLGKAILISTFLWIFFRAKENNLKLFGYNLPWNEEHHHEEHLNFENAGEHGDAMPTLQADEEHEDHDEHEEDD